MKKNFPLLLFSAFLMTSCSLAPNYTRPSMNVPPEWSIKQPNQTETSRIAFDWWKSFDSEELNQLMTTGLNNNLDLKASYQRIQQARASLKVARSSLLPSVDVSANLSRDQSIRGGKGLKDRETNFDTSINVNYELDLFGANQSNVDSSRFSLLSTKYQHDALALVIMGDIAQNYFNVLNARERLTIADNNLKNAQEIMRIVQARYDAGAASGLEVAQQKSSLASFEALRASNEQEIKINEDALAILLGDAPQSLVVAKNDLAGLNIPDIATSQPSSLITRRPDIASAEADLKAANADIGAARAAFLPSINLSGGITAIAAPVSSPITAGLSTASSILAPIFSGGSLTGNLLLTEARKAELVEAYRKTILVSFQEVEDALAAQKASAIREAAFKTAMDEAQKAYDISLLRYKAGSIDFQTVVDTQSSLLSAQQNYSLSRNERLSASINLFKALGGGWQSGGA